MKQTTRIIFALYLTALPAYAQVFDVDTIQYNGDIHHLINLVILGDGYQEHELPQYLIDASNFTETFFSSRPYTEYQQFFNVFAIKVPSNESGASHPGTATDVDEPEIPVIEVDNYFGSTFDYFDIHRLLVPVNTVAISKVLAENFSSYDQAVVLVNTPHYGGSGGAVATATTNPASSDVAVHEIGHSFAWLADEYWVADYAARETVNMTRETSPSVVKWKNWLGDEGIGIYQHCCGETSAEWYRPHENCKMRFLNVPFCAVCVEGTIEKIHELTSPLISYSPMDLSLTAKGDFDKFKIELIEPNPTTLKRRWFLNDIELDADSDSLDFTELHLITGKNTLTVMVEDTTDLLRVDGHENLHVASVTWYIDQAAIHVDVDQRICEGDSIFLQGEFQSVRGVYLDTILVSGGPDTVYATTLQVETVDVSVSQEDITLTANLEGAFYQWLDCRGHVAVGGAVDQSFSPAENGEFAAEITFNGCVDTTECFTVNTIDVLENKMKDTFKAYPNPTEGKLYINLETVDQLTAYSLRIIGSDGRICYYQELNSREFQIDMSDMGSEGLYYLQLVGAGGGVLAVRKIVRK